MASVDVPRPVSDAGDPSEDLDDQDIPQEDYEGEAQAIGRLEFIERIEVVRNRRTGKPTGSVVSRYRYPPQEMDSPV